MIVFAVLALIAITPVTAETGCASECASIRSNIEFCGNIINGFQDPLPTIGIDPRFDDCLCNQENVRLYRTCLVCNALSTADSATNRFISDCKINDDTRNLNNGDPFKLKSLPIIGTCIVAFVAIAKVVTYSKNQRSKKE
ncbi:hypothetical protein BGZ76_005853 [Entomortierella beljakovae]|nr:hypothetical protein BGZ76_005853 [Entomortierella beljakovae]